MAMARRLRALMVCLLAAVALLGCLHPTVALAAGTPPQEVEVGGTDVTAGGYSANDGAGGLVPGDASNYNVHYDGAGTLTLRDAVLDGDESRPSSTPRRSTHTRTASARSTSRSSWKAPAR